MERWLWSDALRYWVGFSAAIPSQSCRPVAHMGQPLVDNTLRHTDAFSTDAFSYGGILLCRSLVAGLPRLESSGSVVCGNLCGEGHRHLYEPDGGCFGCRDADSCRLVRRNTGNFRLLLGADKSSGAVGRRSTTW